jgi:hypothetical protein
MNIAVVSVLTLLMCAGTGIQLQAEDRAVPVSSVLSSPYFNEKGDKGSVIPELIDVLRQGGKPDSVSTADGSASELRFVYVRALANQYAAQKDYPKLANFLTVWVRSHPTDKYNPYYLLMTAWAYTKMNAYPVAAVYFNEIVRNYDDLFVRGQSIHLICLKELIKLSVKPEERIWYYEELLSRFADKIDQAQAWFMLGKTREQVGDWNGALDAYTEFLQYYGTEIPGYPNAYSYAKQMVDLSKSSRDWTFDTLDELLAAVRKALDAGNVRRLWSYRAKVGFFARSWAQDPTDVTEAVFNLAAFPVNSKLHYSVTLSPGSTPNEVYLKTWGWPQFTSIWYFYFRKVNFPPDPSIHGHWEWAGIYYGEKF